MTIGSTTPVMSALIVDFILDFKCIRLLIIIDFIHDFEVI